MRMRRELQLKVARAIYKVEAADGDPDYSRLAPILKTQYERQASATYTIIKAALSAPDGDSK